MFFLSEWDYAAKFAAKFGTDTVKKLLLVYIHLKYVTWLCKVPFFSKNYHYFLEAFDLGKYLFALFQTVCVVYILVSSRDPCLATAVMCNPWDCKPRILPFRPCQSAPRSSNSGHPGSEVTHLHEPGGEGCLLDMVYQDRQKEFSLSSTERNSRNWHSWRSRDSNCCLAKVE